METNLLQATAPALDVPAESTQSVRSGQNGPETISGLRKSLLHTRLRLTLLSELMACYPNPLDWIRGLRYLIRLRRNILGDHRLWKFVRTGKGYHMGLFTPAWPGKGFRQFIAGELRHFKPHKRPVPGLNQVFWAITRKCPLQCEHCYAWDTLNEKDPLGPAEFRQILEKLRISGVGQLYFTGGEPLMRLNLLEDLVALASPEITTWINTSGYHLDREKCRRLRHAGLSGCFISLDHYREGSHNDFRGNTEAYAWAIRAAGNALEEGLVVALSVCLEDANCTEEWLMAYMAHAGNLGVHFVQFLEPKAVGHFRGRSVALGREAVEMAESVFTRLNFTREGAGYPIISYHGYYQRRAGCFGAGSRGVHIDAAGNVQACPYCQRSYGNLNEVELQEVLGRMDGSACQQAASWN